MTRRPGSTFANPLVSVVMPVYNEQDTIEEIDGRGDDELKKITWKDGVVAVWTLLNDRFTE